MQAGKALLLQVRRQEDKNRQVPELGSPLPQLRRQEDKNLQDQSVLELLDHLPLVRSRLQHL